MKKLLSHLLLLNILVLALGWWLTNDFPERVYITVDTQSGMVLQTDCGRGCRFDGDGVQTQHFWLPAGFFNGDLTLHRRAGGGGIVSSVSVWSRLVFERKWTNPQSLAFSSDGKLTLSQSEGALGLSRVGKLAVFGGELALLILAAVFMLLARPLPAKSVRVSRFNAVVVSVAASLFCAIVIPIQTLLSNQSELGLDVGTVVWALSGRALLIAAVLFVLLGWSTRFAKSLYLLLVGTLVLYEYLETGVLSIGCPRLTGDVTFYKNVTRMIWDASVIPVCFMILYLLTCFVRPAVVFVPCVVCALGLSSLLDVKQPEQKSRTDTIKSFCPRYRVATQCVYSTNRNVLVYVLDSMATTYLQELFKLNPKFVEPLTGFTFYTNNLGMAGTTVEGVAGMVTGKYQEDLTKSSEYAHSVYSRDSLLNCYIDGESSVSFCPSSVDKGVSLGGCGASDKPMADNSSPIHKRMAGQQPWTLLEIARFRMMPFAGKFIDYVLTVGGWNTGGGVENETWLYPILEKAPATNSPLALQWFHTVGMHGPYGVSRTGVNDGCVREGDDAKLNMLWYVWSQLMDLFSVLKQRGLYESSLIVVTADHGCERDANELKSSLSHRSWPALLVKPPFETNSLRQVNVPTCHSKIHDLMVRAHDESLDSRTVDDILRCEDRCFSSVDFDKGGFQHVYVDADGNSSVRFVKSVGVSQENVPIEEDRCYSLLGDNFEDVPPLQLKYIGRFSAGGPLMAGNKSEDSVMKFRVSSKGDFLVTLDINANAGAVLEDLVSARSYVVPTSKGYIRHSCNLLATPNDSGIISLAIRSREFISLYSLEVSKE